MSPRIAELLASDTLAPEQRLCPDCGSTRVYGLTLPARGQLAGCPACKAIWEPLPIGTPPDREGKPQPFRKACDNCAFRQGSPERADREAWWSLQMGLAGSGRPFYCHKGVPLQVEGDGYASPDGESHGFRYPVTADGKAHDLGRMRVCAGFIAWWKGFKTDEPVPGL